MKQESLFSRPQPAAPLPVEQVQGVRSVVDYIKRVLEQSRTLSALRVRGEISGLRDRNGHRFFDLKEQEAVLKCVVWASNVSKLPPLKDGIEVICDGKFTVSERYSQYELIVRGVELSGVGALYAQFEQLKEKFLKEGLFERGRKRPMPPFPTRVAVISAKDGAGAGDFSTTMAREAPFVELIVIPTRVEGDGAEIDVADAIRSASRMQVDAIVITRGGGSYESLFTFNREPVLRAIVAAKHPVLSAIGHTQDVLLSDFVADYSCETPSNAAHYFAQIGKRYLNRVRVASSTLDHLMKRIAIGDSQRLEGASSQLDQTMREYLREMKLRMHEIDRRLTRHRPDTQLRVRRERLTRAVSSLESLRRHALDLQMRRASQSADAMNRLRETVQGREKNRLDLLRAQLEGLNPQSPLERGYAIVTLDGRAVRDAEAVPNGAVIEAQVRRGRLRARVEGKDLDA